MLRNIELKVFLFIILLTGIFGCSFILFINITCGIIAVIMAAVLIFCFFIFNRLRYRQIQKLSDYLKQISNGDFSLDVRDNREGELSILKNEIYKVTNTLSEQAELLKKEKLYLSKSLSDISHQLKTPLTSMLVMTDLLKEDIERRELPIEKKTEFINNIHIQLERIEWLVSSLLKLSKLDSGAVIFKQERISAILLIQKISAPFLILTDIKGQNLEIKGSGNPFCTIDLNWTAEALSNILKNCIDHTPEGGKIEIKYDENPLYIEIVINDNGSGIDKKDLPYIFNRYYKARNANEDSVGIGLALTKNILQAQNADVSVKSVIGEGTEFSIKFYNTK